MDKRASIQVVGCVCSILYINKIYTTCYIYYLLYINFFILDIGIRGTVGTKSISGKKK